MIKKIGFFACLLLTASLTACGSKAQPTEAPVSEETQQVEETTSVENNEEVTESSAVYMEKMTRDNVKLFTNIDYDLARIEYLPGKEPEKIYASELGEGKDNPLSYYDGYYSTVDEDGYLCYLSIKDGFLDFIVRGIYSEGVVTELYIENNHAYVEYDGEIIQLGDKNRTTVEYAKAGDNFPSYMQVFAGVDAEFFEADVARILAEEADYEAQRREEIERIKAETEGYSDDDDDEKSPFGVGNDKKEDVGDKDALLAQKRRKDGWIKGQIASWDVSEGYAHFVINIEEANDSKIFIAGVIEIFCDEFDTCTNNFSELYNYCSDSMYSGTGNGVSFEMIIAPHSCSMSGYTVVDFIG